MILKTFIRELLEEQFRIKVKVQDTNNLEEELQSFVEFCSERLGINSMPPINVVNQIQGGTHGVYYPSGNLKIGVVGRGRHLSDILRSLAHEIVHHQQNEQDRLEIINDDGVGGHIENEANSVAGQLVKAYGRENPHIYKTF